MQECLTTCWLCKASLHTTTEQLRHPDRTTENPKCLLNLVINWTFRNNCFSCSYWNSQIINSPAPHMQPKLFTPVYWCKNKSSAHQPFLSGLRGGHGQVLSPGIEGVNLDAPVGLRLPQPHTQHLFDVYTLPRADPGFHVDLQGADAYVPVPVCDRHQAGDLQEHGGRLVRRAQMHPELRPDDAIGLKLWSKREKAALWLPIHLDDGLGWRQKETGKMFCIY